MSLPITAAAFLPDAPLRCSDAARIESLLFHTLPKQSRSDHSHRTALQRFAVACSRISSRRLAAAMPSETMRFFAGARFLDAIVTQCFSLASPSVAQQCPRKSSLCRCHTKPRFPLRNNASARRFDAMVSIAHAMPISASSRHISADSPLHQCPAMRFCAISRRYDSSPPHVISIPLLLRPLHCSALTMFSFSWLCRICSKRVHSMPMQIISVRFIAYHSRYRATDLLHTLLPTYCTGYL